MRKPMETSIKTSCFSRTAGKHFAAGIDFTHRDARNSCIPVRFTCPENHWLSQWSKSFSYE